MQKRRRSRWLLMPLLVLSIGVIMATRGDAFDELGPPVPVLGAPPTYRRFRVPGDEIEAKRRIEAAMARDGGWRFLSRSTEPISPQWTDVFYLYRNDEVGGEAEMQYIPAREPGDRAILDIHRTTGWRLARARLILWWRRYGL